MKVGFQIELIIKVSRTTRVSALLSLNLYIAFEFRENLKQAH